MPMAIGGASRAAPFPVPAPEARPAPVAALVANLAGVSTSAHRFTEQAPPSGHCPTSWHGQSQRTFADADALAPPPKRARLAGAATPLGSELTPATGALDPACQRGLEVLTELIGSNSH